MDPMEERTIKVEKDDQGRETFRKTIWKCKYPIVGVDGRSLNLNLVYELNNDRENLRRCYCTFWLYPLWSYTHARNTVDILSYSTRFLEYNWLWCKV
jgi:hypothetical protein